MVEISPSVFFYILVFLSVPFATAYVLRRYRISPIIGYILGGIFLGTFFQKFISFDVIYTFAYVGIVLLLFTIGLEVQLSKLQKLKKYIVIGGTLQIAISLVVITALTQLFHFDFVQSLLIGIAFTSSSTAIVAKILQDRGEENSFIGEIAIGVLMYQDLAFIPFIIIFSYFHGHGTNLAEAVVEILTGCFKAALILAAMYYLGRSIIPRLFHSVARISRELLNFFIIIFIVAIGALCTWLGIPILVGSFIAGVLVSQTSEHYHVFSQIRPLRDILAVVFFIFIGSQLSLGALVPIIGPVLLYSALLILVKFLVLTTLFIYLRFSSRMAFSIGIFLFQVSENAFILLSLAYKNGVFTQQQYLFLTASSVISLLATPFLILHKDTAYLIIRKFIKKNLPPLEIFIRHKIDFAGATMQSVERKNHIIICGFGRMGSRIGRALELAKIPYVGLDYNYQIVERSRQEGGDVVYGDPTDMDILSFVGVEQAHAVVIMIPSHHDQESIILNIRKLNPKALIISRAHNDNARLRMKDLGAHAIISPEFEASLSVIRKLFALKQLHRDDVVKHIRHLKVMHGDVRSL